MIELIKAQSNINYKPDPQRVGKHQASPPFVTSSQLLISSYLNNFIQFTPICVALKVIKPDLGYWLGGLT